MTYIRQQDENYSMTTTNTNYILKSIVSKCQTPLKYCICMYSLNKDGIDVYLLTKSDLPHKRQLFCESFKNIMCWKVYSYDNIILSLKLELTKHF